MNIHRSAWGIIAAVVILIVGILLAVSTYRNRLSGTTIQGRWQGYILQPAGTDGRKDAVRVPLAFTFRPDGVVTRGSGRADARYMVCDSALVFYDIRSHNAPPHPILWNARLVGDTLTLSGSGPVAVLTRTALK